MSRGLTDLGSARLAVGTTALLLVVSTVGLLALLLTLTACQQANDAAPMEDVSLEATQSTPASVAQDGMAEGIVVGATYQPPPPRPPAAPAAGTRRSRLHDMVGYSP